MKSYPSTTVISYLHVAANSIIRARVEHGITDSVLTACGIKGYLAYLFCQGEINESIHDHHVELTLTFFDRHLCSILHDESNALCLDETLAFTDKQGIFGNRIGTGYLVG
ncbi:MAG: hypothetical protein QTN59_18640 [Candidatus Electrothrix communis]|nr:hypothetical protein [Desulfobulbus sp. US4]WLE96688.1 MAG: hypothetical protein QTN59_18640 [Candidatus Electrothrix communis]